GVVVGGDIANDVFVADSGEPVLAVDKQIGPVIRQAFLGKQVVALQATIVQLVHASLGVGAAIIHLVAGITGVVAAIRACVALWWYWCLEVGDAFAGYGNALRRRNVGQCRCGSVAFTAAAEQQCGRQQAGTGKPT